MQTTFYIQLTYNLIAQVDTHLTSDMTSEKANQLWEDSGNAAYEDREREHFKSNMDSFTEERPPMPKYQRNRKVWKINFLQPHYEKGECFTLESEHWLKLKQEIAELEKYTEEEEITEFWN